MASTMQQGGLYGMPLQGTYDWFSGMQGSQGNDIYLFGKGDGQDSIIDNSNVGEINVLQFKSDVTPTKVTVSHLGNDLILSIIGTTDKITVNSSFNNELNS